MSIFAGKRNFHATVFFFPGFICAFKLFERHLRMTSIFVILFLMSSTAFATSIVAVRSNDEIVIGADSKTSLTPMLNNMTDPKGIEKCKIVQTGNIFFASAGFAGIGPAKFPGNIDPEFNIAEIIVNALKGEGSIECKVNNLEKILVANLSQIVEKERVENAAFFADRFVRYPIFSIIVVGFDNDDLIIMDRTFKLIISPLGSLSFEIGRFACPGDCQESFITIFAGRTEAIRKFLHENNSYLLNTDATTAVSNLVEMEIAKDSSFVGPPIDILRLTRKGAEWIKRKSLCPDIQNNNIMPDGGSNIR